MRGNPNLHDPHPPTHDLLVAHFVICLLVGIAGVINILAQKPAHARIYDQWAERVYDDEFRKYFSQDSVYVELTPEASEQTLQDLKKNGIILSYSKPFADLDISSYRIQFRTTNQEKIKTILNIMQKNNQIASSEPVPIYTIQQATWTALQATINTQWYLADIGLIKGQVDCLSSDHPKPRIAIIDNAFLTGHPNLAGQITKTIDIADGDDDVSPPREQAERWHGTMSAGLIAGIPREGNGILGTSLGNAEIIAIKATQDFAEPTQITHGIEALKAALDAQADIVVMSRGSPQDSNLFRQVIDKVKARGVQIIAAAGNQGSSKPFFPATYDEVIAVGAYDRDGTQAFFSNHGPRVDIYAPGVDLTVPTIQDQYTVTEGTSLAAPIYAGLYALLSRYFGKPDYVPFFLENRNQLIDGKPMLTAYNICAKPPAPEEHTAPSESPLPESVEQVEVPAGPVDTPSQPTGFATQSVGIYPAVLPTELAATVPAGENYERKLWAVLAILSTITLLLRSIEPHLHEEESTS